MEHILTHHNATLTEPMIKHIYLLNNRTNFLQKTNIIAKTANNHYLHAQTHNQSLEFGDKMHCLQTEFSNLYMTRKSKYLETK